MRSDGAAGLHPASVRSFEQMLASFAYKPHRRADDSPCVAGPDTPSPPAEAKKKRKRRRSEEEDDKKPPQPPSSPSSYVRTTIDGKTVLVSRFFPLPPTASAPVVLSKHEVDRARRRARRHTALRRTALPLKKPRQSRAAGGSKSSADAGRDVGDGEDEEKNAKRKERKRSIQRSQLTVAEKKSDAYRRVGVDNAWEPPASCHNLLQERHSFDPWRVLIICMLLNITSGKQVQKVLPGLFLLCPDAETAAKVPVEEIEQVIQTLGLQKKRAKMIQRFSQEYLDPEWTHVTQLHGVGKYAADAYAIFCVGKPDEVIPEDHKLVDYWKLVCGKAGKDEQMASSQN